MVAGEDDFFVAAGAGQGFQFLPQGFHHPVRRGYRILAASNQQQVPVLEPVGVLDKAPLPGMLDAVLPQIFETAYMEDRRNLSEHFFQLCVGDMFQSCLMVIGAEGHGAFEKGQVPGGIEHCVASVGMTCQEDVLPVDTIGFGHVFPGPAGQDNGILDAVGKGINPFAAPGTPMVGTDHHTAHPT